MGKTAISQKRAISSAVRVSKLRAGASVSPYDPSKSLGDPKFVQEAIIEALLDGDCAAVMHIYSAHLRVLNRSKTAAKLRVSRQHVHRMMSNPNPRMDTFARFMGLLKTETAAVKA
jgi:DNA-binding phage protein